MYLLPFLIFPYIASSVSLLKYNGFMFLGSFIILITVSNFISILVGGGVAFSVIPHLTIQTTFNVHSTQSLLPFFDFKLAPLFNIEMVLIAGFLSGFVLSAYPNGSIKNFLNKYKYFSSQFFSKAFISILPLYIFGTLLKINYENNFYKIFIDFRSIIFIIFTTQFLYIFFVFYLGTSCSIKRTVQCWRNSLPAAFLGFSTMSSFITMPVTLKVAEKNLDDKDLAHIAITTTVNCHEIGECISLTIIALTVYSMGNDTVLPPLNVFLHFAFMLAIAQFTGISVPGGSTVVIAPLLITHLDFSNEMIGLVTILSIFMDPVGTSSNVMGNSAFSLIIQKYFNAVKNIRKKSNMSDKKYAKSSP